jgi:Spy/CpxP family protein refolding chaperone
MNQSTSENTPDSGSKCRRTGKLRFIAWTGGLISLGAVLGVLIAGSTSAIAGFGGHWGGHHGKGSASLGQMQEHVEDRLEWVLGALDTSDEQSTQIKFITKDLVSNLYPLKDQHRANKRSFMEQLSSETPDAAVLEDLRRQELQLADVASAQVLAALLKSNDVLTSEQREKIAKRFRRHRNHDKDKD